MFYLEAVISNKIQSFTQSNFSPYSSYTRVKTHGRNQVFIGYRKELDKTKWFCPWNSDQNFTQNSAIGWEGWWSGWGRSDIRTKVKSLKIYIVERTRICESLLLKITYLNIFVENNEKITVIF